MAREVLIRDTLCSKQFLNSELSFSCSEKDLNPTALRKAKIAYNFGLSKCNRVKIDLYNLFTAQNPKSNDP